MEEDRERVSLGTYKPAAFSLKMQHKRLRERIWILPIPSLASSSPSTSRPSRTHTAAALASTFQSPSSTSPATPATPASPSSRRRPTGPVVDKQMLPPPVPTAVPDGPITVTASALDVEFETLWETEPALDADDLATMSE
jgi:CTD kinase subunit gamma